MFMNVKKVEKLGMLKTKINPNHKIYEEKKM